MHTSLDSGTRLSSLYQNALSINYTCLETIPELLILPLKNMLEHMFKTPTPSDFSVRNDEASGVDLRLVLACGWFYTNWSCRLISLDTVLNVEQTRSRFSVERELKADSRATTERNASERTSNFPDIKIFMTRWPVFFFGDKNVTRRKSP